jgi:hypothetical protein
MPQIDSENFKEKEERDELLSIQFRSTCGRLGSPVFLCEPPYDLHFGSLYNRAWKFGPQLLGVYIGPAPIPEQSRSRSIEQLMGTMEEKRQLGRECLVVPIWKLLAMLQSDKADARSDYHRIPSDLVCRA